MRVDGCNTNLGLSIGGGEFTSNKHHGREEIRRPPSNRFTLFPRRPAAGEGDDRVRKRPRSASRSEDGEAAENGDAKEARRDERAGGRRKKLRLSKEQLAFLENSFTEHSTLNLKQKQELASQLRIQPRQVEVWFQNRRARTKLKQTEGDYKSLKQQCENLSEENQKLMEEIEELRSRNNIRGGSPIYPQIPTLAAMCPSCGQRAAASSDGFCVKKEQESWSLYIAGG
ncbi:homeobox-leucine zipper protein HAT14-like isoform X2 [Curcuma longa]|uniref:homeobox-leucine zipper protein HAT14-like isoform X2 n=1 Tax=Curcuma longa TaxID=136217 RepID=UPI003D9DDB9C